MQGQNKKPNKTPGNGGSESSLLQEPPQSQAATPSPGGDTRGRRQILLGLLDHTFAEVCHFGIFYFLLVQLILSPKE